MLLRGYRLFPPSVQDRGQATLYELQNRIELAVESALWLCMKSTRPKLTPGEIGVNDDTTWPRRAQAPWASVFRKVRNADMPVCRMRSLGEKAGVLLGEWNTPTPHSPKDYRGLDGVYPTKSCPAVGGASKMSLFPNVHLQNILFC